MVNYNLKYISSSELFILLDEYTDLKNYAIISPRSKFVVENGKTDIIRIDEFEHKGYILKKEKLAPIGYRVEDFTRYEYYLDSNTNEFYIYIINIYKGLNELENIQIHRVEKNII